MKTLQELRDDFKKLKDYMFVDPQRVVEYRDLQRGYTELVKKSQNSMDRDDIERELNSVRNTLNITLAIGGILISIFGGVTFITKRQAAEPSKTNGPEGPGRLTDPASPEDSGEQKKPQK
jgi:hypothetical protein